MSKGKACGPDNIPAEIYKRSEICKELIVKMLQKIWSNEEVPDQFARAVFAMLFKNKGSANDPKKYR